MKWGDIRPGMLVYGEGDDFFEAQGCTSEELARTEYPFTFVGLVDQVTQRRLIIRGVWKWQCAAEDLKNDDERRGEAGVFGMPRGGVVFCSELVPARTWHNPAYED